MLVAPALYATWVGPQDAYVWIYRYSKLLNPVNQGRFMSLRVLREQLGKFIITLSFFQWRMSRS